MCTNRQFDDTILVTDVALLAAMERGSAARPRLFTCRSPVTHVRQGASLAEGGEASAAAALDDDWLLVGEHPVEVVLPIAQLHLEPGHLLAQSFRLLLAVLSVIDHYFTSGFITYE